ncbi:MAG TPA: cell division ATP-binding protein FtsE [Bacillota bacterium]|nr:cell division ATP-binding protein FtsE [Bacillota bacterium]
MIGMFNVSKTYDNGVKALIDANVRINKGEFVFLVGTSGAGKSTFIKMLFKEEEPTRGHIMINGINLGRMKNREVPYLRRKIGVVFQDFRLLPNKTVFENVAFALQIAEASSRDIKKLVPAALELVGLSSRAYDLPSSLSGGEQQRVGLARAIVNKPMMLVADEPTGNLDPDTSWEIMKLLSDISNMGTTVVMATHAKDIVDAMQKRVIAIENGRIVRDEQKGAYGYEN